MGKVSPTQALSAAGYLLAWKIVGWLPHKLARSLFDIGARVAWRRAQRGSGLSGLSSNLEAILDKQRVNDALLLAAVRSYARYWCEAFRLPKLVASPSRKRTLLQTLDASVRGQQHLDASVAEGRGVILVLTHSGNWDMAGLWLANYAGEFTTVAERLKPEILYQRFLSFRQGLGFRVLPLSGGQPAYPQLQNVLRAGGIVCLLGERDLKHNGMPVEFGSIKATMPTGAATLAAETGAALHVAHCFFQGQQGWGFDISPELDRQLIQRGTGATLQAVADLMVEQLRAHPEDWHVLQPLSRPKTDDEVGEQP